MTTPADSLSQVANPPLSNPDIGAVGTYPTVVRVGPSDQVNSSSANQQPIALETRAETLRATLNTLITQFNLLDTWFLRRDGSAQKDTFSGLTGPLNANGNIIRGLPAASFPDQPVRQQEFDAALFGVTQPYTCAVAMYSSAGTWTVPANTGRVSSIIIGGGGGGGAGVAGGTQKNQGGGGASGSALLCGFTIAPGTVLSLSPGAGGAAGSAGASSLLSIGATSLAVVPGGAAGSTAGINIPGMGGVAATSLSGFQLVTAGVLGNAPAFGQRGADGIATPTTISLGAGRACGGRAPFGYHYGAGGDGGPASGGAGLAGTGGVIILMY